MADTSIATCDPTISEISPVDSRMNRAAERIGVVADEVERLPFDLSALEDEGVFVNVDARGFGLLDRRLDWHALGITLPQRAGLAFHPPRCGLLPDRYRLPLLRPPARAHAALHKYSYRFTLTETLFETPAYRWVPWSAFDAFERDFRAAHTALDEAKAVVLEDYEVIRAEVVETFLQLGADSARRLAATGHFIPDGFQDVVVQRVLATMPTAEDLEEKLRLRFRVGVVLLGSEMLAEQRKAREERQKLERAEAALGIERKRQEARARLVQEELWVKEERLRRRLQAEEEERLREAAVKERLRQLKLDTAKERLAEAMSPLEEGAKQLHAAIYESAVAIHASLQKHHYLHGSSARRARELASWFRLMNWQSDNQLEGLITELERLARRPVGSRKRDAGQIDEVLEDIIALCYADTQAIAEPHRMTSLEF